MNALELADVIEKFVLDGATDLVCVYDSVIMLRQQQARIEELEKCTTAYAGFDPHDEYLAKIGSMTKMQSDLIFENEALKAKTLTDEEIWSVANDYFVGKSDLVYGFARAILRKANKK